MIKQIKNENATDAVLVELNPGEFLNLDEKFKWKENLNPRQKRFVYYEATIPENTKGKTILCARKAGYEEGIAKSIGYRMLKQEKVLREIENLKGQLALNKDCKGSESSEKEKQSVLDTVYVELEDKPGNFLDLNKVFEWEATLSSKQRRFAFLYAKACLNNTIKGNKVRIAIKAGFSVSFAQKNVYQILQDPKMVEAIQSIMNQIKIKDINEYIEEKEDAADHTYVQIESGEIVDLDTFDWDDGINNIQKKFIFFYVYPFPNSIKSNGPACAVKAGYKPSSAYLTSYRLLRDPKIILQMKRLKAQITEGPDGKDLVDFIKANVKDIVARKVKILNMSPLDLYDFFSVIDENGIEETKAKAKLPEEIPEEKKMLIEDIEYVGKKGSIHFSLPSKSKAEEVILSLYKELCYKTEKDSDSEGGTVYSLIRERIEDGEAFMKRNEELSKLAGFECITANTLKED